MFYKIQLQFKLRQTIGLLRHSTVTGEHTQHLLTVTVGQTDWQTGTFADRQTDWQTSETQTVTI